MVAPVHRALHVRAETHRHALVRQPRRCRKRPDAKPLFRNVRIFDRRAGRRSRPLRQGGAALRPITGKARGSACKISAKARRPTMAWRCSTRRRPSTTRCSATASRFACARASVVLVSISSNASPTENITLALPGHRFTVIALDERGALAAKCRHAVSRAGGACHVIVELTTPALGFGG